MKNHLKLHLFGDQTFNQTFHLKELLKNRDNCVLENFLERAYRTIRSEIYTLPVEARDEIPRFTCLDDLVIWNDTNKGKRCIPLDMAITCMYQISMFITQENGTSFDADTTRVAGLCTGALAAAAVCCSSTNLDLIPLATTAVKVAFRIGRRVTDVSQRISTSFDATATWSIAVPTLASIRAVDKFCEETTLPTTTRPYISAYAPNGVTVSGPPSSLTQLLESEHFKGLISKGIPTYGPYHAMHLYSQFDIEDIIGDLISAGSLDTYSEKIPLLSTSGTKGQRSSFSTLLKDAVAKILLEPIKWGDILEDLQSWIQHDDTESFEVIPIGTTADQLIYTAFKQTKMSSLLPTKRIQRENLFSNSPANPDPKNAKLAIIGMSGRFPGARDNDAFWELLHQGLDVHKPVPPLHWDSKTHVDPTGSRKNTSAASFGCWLDDPAVFDARFFNISPREAPQIDPAQRLALMTAYEAIEQAGIVPDATPSTRRDRVGVFYGVTSNDWMETNSAQNIDTYFIPGGNRAFIPGRINYYFKFSGPSYAVDTACSSSLAGIHLACNSLWRGDIDTAIAGGTNVLTNPDFTAGLDRGYFLSRTGNCKTFDDEADGYCRGEGIGTVILKRLDDALADNDPILGVILGAFTNHSAESESITRPHVGAQRAIFSKILNQGAVDPYSVSYVEMHGTGTQAGDAGEMSSVLDTFAPPLSRVERGRNTDEALYLGSAKANIGHGEAASGVSSLIKVLLMMQKDTIVPHCGIKNRINRKFPTDLQDRNVNIALEPISWKRSNDPEKPRRVFVNNFSAAGGNSAILLEDAPLDDAVAGSRPTDQRTHHVVTVSAKNGVSLQGNLKSMLKFLKKNPEIPLGQLSYTTTARRIHHPHRVALIGSTAQTLCTQIEEHLANQTGMTRPKGTAKVVFTFTGQGAQYPGMGKELLDNFSVFRNEMHRLDHIGESLGFPSMLPVIESENPDINLFTSLAVQLANVCMQISLNKLLASWDIRPDAVVGHSLGEYAALAVAGVISDADAVYLVGKRAQLLEKKCTRNTHSMLVVKASVSDIASVLGDRPYEIACINSPLETVLAGPNEAIAIFKSLLTEGGLKSIQMKLPYAFHSSQVDPILTEFQSLAAGVTYSESRVPFLCPLDGNLVEGGIGVFGPEYLARHARESVNMNKALEAARLHGLITDKTSILEVGPHPAVSGMVKAVLGPQITCLATCQRTKSTWQVLASSLAHLYVSGANIGWLKYHEDFKSSHKVHALPAYSWDLKEYWIQYVNDWSLRKGDPPLIKESASKVLESTTIHRIVEEISDSSSTRIIVEADIAREDLRPLVQGHEVDGIPLCTPSVYADIGLSLGNYLFQRYRPEEEQKIVEIANMTISKALILREGASQQLLQAHAEVDWTSNSTTFKFMSFDSKQKLQEHARCVLHFKDGSLRKELQENAATIKQKIQRLKEGIPAGVTARFNRPMVYRAIRPLARFHDDYRAIDEIVLNSSTLEAVSRLSFGSVKKGGKFHTHPAIIDSLSQSCGFTMNCNDDSDLDIEVFMNHGWGSFQIFEPMDFNKEYTTYSQMFEGADKLWHGDVVVFDGDQVVAHFGQISIQGVPRRVLKVILSIESGVKSQKQPPAQNKQPGAMHLNLPTLAASQHNFLSKGASSPSKFLQALSIIAEESGIALSDLTDSTNFGDVGIDSLLGLTISARFKEELDVELEFSTLFFEYPIVQDLKILLDGAGASDIPISLWSYDGERSSAVPSVATGRTTPVADEVDFNAVLNIISEESGVTIDDLTDDTDFADAGVDSLLSLVIVHRLRDELELDIQHESFFLECPTVSALKKVLFEGSNNTEHVFTQQDVEKVPMTTPEGALVVDSAVSDDKWVPTEREAVALAVRRQAVDEYVAKYVGGFSGPESQNESVFDERDGAKVVLVTGATGSLGGHLVHHIAHLPEVKTVVCLNRDNRAGAYEHQQKAMREKGIRSFDKLRPKLMVYQTDSTKPKLGLPTDVYETLVCSVTHLIHNAWPMSAKRSLEGFESQFQVMRNLIDFACDVSSRRPQGFKFSFQMVSSIGVVGHYGLWDGKTKITVPEERVDIDSVLPNGYGEAKWGCERMLDETLHKHPDRFRTMAVRLGQIAGSKTSGYWNPMEHFGFLIKSSQTLNALPVVDGSAFWTPVNDVAGTLSDLVLSNCTPQAIYHVENPIGQSWKDLNVILSSALNIPNLIPFTDWVERVRAAPQRNNPAATLLSFLDSNFARMSCGGLVLDVKNTLKDSPTLSAVGPVSEEVIRKYIHIWKEIGFLN